MRKMKRGARIRDGAATRSPRLQFPRLRQPSRQGSNVFDGRGEMFDENDTTDDPTPDDLGVRPEVAHRLVAMAHAQNPSWTGTDPHEAAWRLLGNIEELLGDAGRGYGLSPEDQEDVRLSALLSVVKALLDGVEIDKLEHFTRHRVRLTVIDLLRRRRKVVAREDELTHAIEGHRDPHATEHLLAAREATRASREILSRMSQQHREVLLGVYGGRSQLAVFRELGALRGAGREILKAAEREFLREARARGLAPLLVLLAVAWNARQSPAPPTTPTRWRGRLAIATLAAAVRPYAPAAVAVLAAGGAGGFALSRCSSNVASSRVSEATGPGAVKLEPSAAAVEPASTPAEQAAGSGVADRDAVGGLVDEGDAAVVSTMTSLDNLAGRITWDFAPTLPLPTELWCLRGIDHADFDWNGCFPTPDGCSGVLEHAPKGHYASCVRDTENASTNAAFVRVTAQKAQGLTAQDLRAPIASDGCPPAVASISTSNLSNGWVILTLAPTGAQGVVAVGQTTNGVHQMTFHPAQEPASALIPGHSSAGFYAWAERCPGDVVAFDISYAVFGAKEIRSGSGVIGTARVAF